MKFFEWAKDGGPESHVTGFFLVEIKSLFSIVILHFDKGTREAFHSHAFNAITLWLRGTVNEVVLLTRPTLLGTEGKLRVVPWHAGQFKYTSRKLEHKVVAPTEGAWALSVRGPWVNTWKEFLPGVKKYITLTHGRKIVEETNV
jgi:hypothetical protein